MFENGGVIQSICSHSLPWCTHSTASFHPEAGVAEKRQRKLHFVNQPKTLATAVGSVM